MERAWTFGLTRALREPPPHRAVRWFGRIDWNSRAALVLLFSASKR
jgi:hypothetical protein